jgi:hypothetical protein
MDNIGVVIAVGCIVLLGLSLALIQMIGMWKTFTKAGQPGWAVLVPIYNGYVMVQVAGGPSWWFILLFIPFANMVGICLISKGIAERFGGGIGLTLLLLFLPMVGYAVTGFGDAKYRAI